MKIVLVFSDKAIFENFLKCERHWKGFIYSQLKITNLNGRTEALEEIQVNVRR